MRKYAFWNNKGGTGKTSLLFQSATMYAESHQKQQVLIIDACPQANLSELLLGGLVSGGSDSLQSLQQQSPRRTIGGYFESRLPSPFTKPEIDVAEFLSKPSESNEAIAGNISLLAGDPLLELQSNAIATLANSQIPGQNPWLAVADWITNFIESAEGSFDVVFIDTNPSFSMYTQIALSSASHLVLPTMADDSSRRAIQNAFSLIHGLNLPSSIYKDYSFTTKLTNDRRDLPKVHLVPMNRLTQYMGPASAYSSVMNQIQSFVGDVLEDNPEVFTFSDMKEGFVDIRDFQTTGVVAFSEGKPFTRLKTRNHFIGGRKTPGYVGAKPNYITAEIREFVELSVLRSKEFNIPVPSGLSWSSSDSYPIRQPQDRKSWGIVGASSGGYLALDTALAPHSQRMNTMITVGNSPIPVFVDTGIGAAAVESPGVDVYNWRFMGDNSYLRRNATIYMHTDLSHLGYPFPSTAPLPANAPAGSRIQFPEPWDDLILDAIVPLPYAKFFPEIYLKLRPNVTINQGLEKQVFSDTLDFALHAGGTNPAANQSAMAPYYPLLPSVWKNLFLGKNIVDYIGANLSNTPPEPDPPILYMYGDCDSVVSPFQPERYKSVYLSVTGSTFDNIFPRTGEKHGYRDIDRKDRGEYVCFFDQELRGIVDADRDGLSDANEPVANNAYDTDGDGQLDGIEYKHSGITGVFAAGGEVDDPSSTFRITSVTKVLDTTLGTWKITIDFDGNGSLGSSDNQYTLQTCKWLFNNDDDSGRAYARWKDVTQDIGLSSLAPGKFRCSILRPVNAANDEKFYRVAMVDPLSKMREVTTAPFGLQKGLIRRNQTPIGGPVAATMINLICSPFHNPDERRVRVDSVSSTATIPVQTTWLHNSGIASPFGSLPSFLTSGATNTGSFGYYAIIQDDFDFSSKRAGRSALPPPPDTPNPEDHGIEGHWWFVDSATANSVTMTERASNQTQASGIPANSSISIRKLTSLADIFEGLRDTRMSPVVPNRWLRALDVVGGIAPSPFLDGDTIRFLPRDSHSVDWSVAMSFSLPWANPLTLRFVDQGVFDGFWVDIANPTIPVDLSTYYLRPDEAIEYNASPAAANDNSETYWISGMVLTSDLIAYVNALAVDSQGNQTFPADRNAPGAQNFGPVSYGVSTVGWPFSADCPLATYFGRSTMFFESGLTMRVDDGTFANNDLPSTFSAGAILFHTDYKLGGGYQGDAPTLSTAIWGDYTGDHQYWAPQLPLVRRVELPGGVRIYGTNIPPGLGGIVDNTVQELRAGRGYHVLLNRTNPSERLIHEWRMRRPYRRP